MPDLQPRAWAEVDLSAIRRNVTALCGMVGPCVSLMAVVKADAYGHGLVPSATAALQGGARWLGVATVEESVLLRERFPDASICLLPAFLPEDAETIAARRIVPLLSGLRAAEALGRAAERLGIITEAHLDIDTGMGRSGFQPAELPDAASRIARIPGLRITGIATHFPSAEDDPAFTRRQIRILHSARETLAAHGIRPEIVHCANSAAILRYPESHGSLVRPGLLIYGIRPGLPADLEVPHVEPALSLKARVLLIRDMAAGACVSYGRTHVLKRASRIATIAIGYGDGYPRALSGRGSALLEGQRAPIVGRVCMDVLMADVSAIPAATEGSVAVLIGAQGGERITVGEMARLADTTEHDITTRLSPRVPRIYVS